MQRMQLELVHLVRHMSVVGTESQNNSLRQEQRWLKAEKEWNPLLNFTKLSMVRISLSSQQTVVLSHA